MRPFLLVPEDEFSHIETCVPHLFCMFSIWLGSVLEGAGLDVFLDARGTSSMTHCLTLLYSTLNTDS